MKSIPRLQVGRTQEENVKFYTGMKTRLVSRVNRSSESPLELKVPTTKITDRPVEVFRHHVESTDKSTNTLHGFESLLNEAANEIATAGFFTNKE